MNNMLNNFFKAKIYLKEFINILHDDFTSGAGATVQTLALRPATRPLALNPWLQNVKYLSSIVKDTMYNVLMVTVNPFQNSHHKFCSASSEMSKLYKVFLALPSLQSTNFRCMPQTISCLYNVKMR